MQRALQRLIFAILTISLSVRAQTAQGDERGRLWELMTQVWPAYDDYQRKTARQIPVVAFERR